MTSSQYRNVLQWTLQDCIPETGDDSSHIVRRVLHNCGVLLPAGSNTEILLALMTDDYMGWRACAYRETQARANDGIPVIGINADRMVLVVPEDSAVRVTSGLTAPAAAEPYAKTAAAITPAERMDMQFFAYAADTTVIYTRPMKIYLSPACHEADKRCAYSNSCGENIHCSQYMNYLESILNGYGFRVKRGTRTGVGTPELDYRISQANSWPADVYYVCHTNGFDGTVRGSRTYVDAGDAQAKRWAEKIKDWRQIIYDQLCQVKFARYREIVDTNMTCLYDEVVYHDNAADAEFFHNNLSRLALYTANAFRDIYDNNI